MTDYGYETDDYAPNVDVAGDDNFYDGGGLEDLRRWGEEREAERAAYIAELRLVAVPGQVAMRQFCASRRH